MARKIKKPYPPEFREEIVKLYREGAKVTDLAREYEISKDSIYSWSKAAGFPETEDDDEEKTREALAAENRELKRQLKQMKMDQEILEKAAAWFAQKSSKKKPSDS
jgi:transposase